MKKLFLLLALFSLVNLYSNNTNEINSSNLEIVQNSYAATAYTENPYGENYSINIVIYGNSTGYSNNLSYITVYGNRINPTPVYGETGKYRFSYNSKTFYFKF